MIPIPRMVVRMVPGILANCRAHSLPIWSMFAATSAWGVPKTPAVPQASSLPSRIEPMYRPSHRSRLEACGTSCTHRDRSASRRWKLELRRFKQDGPPAIPFGFSCFMASAFELICNQRIHRKPAGPFNEQRHRQADDEEMIFKPFPLLRAKPVHEEPIGCVHFKGTDHR